MPRLLIQFTDDELVDFRWATFDEVTDSGVLNWQQAAAHELPEVAVQNPHPVIIVIPQQCVYLTEIELPEKASRQVLSAIEYQVEDQLAQDIESQHFAIGDISENPIAIAVVARPIMERCMALARSHDLRLTQIVPELFLCPWPGDGVALIEGYDGYLLRYGKCRGLKCSAQALPVMLELVERDVEFDTITFYGTETEHDYILWYGNRDCTHCREIYAATTIAQFDLAWTCRWPVDRSAAARLPALFGLAGSGKNLEMDCAVVCRTACAWHLQ